MKTRHVLTQTLLWAAAIFVTASVGAPTMLYSILLPALAVIAMLMMNARCQGCATS